MRLLAVLVLGLWPISAIGEDATPAATALIACGARNIRVLDDRVSPATIVAKEIAGFCRKEIHEAAAAPVAGLPALDEAGIANTELILLKGEVFVPLVLMSRAKALRHDALKPE